MAVNIFCCYAHEDGALLKKLKTHLRPLQREGLIELWDDRDISAGAEWEHEIREHLDAAQIILLLVSPDFMNSDYCYSVEMKHALERHERGEARVIPIILRPVLWEEAPFSKLKALPDNAEHVVTVSLYTIDHTLLDVTKGIRKVIEAFVAKPVIRSSEKPVPKPVNRSDEKPKEQAQYGPQVLSSQSQAVLPNLIKRSVVSTVNTTTGIVLIIIGAIFVIIGIFSFFLPSSDNQGYGIILAVLLMIPGIAMIYFGRRMIRK
jgi:hypothetical protein